MGGPLHTLLSDPVVTRLGVGPLGEESVGSMIEQSLGAEPQKSFVAAAHRVSAGNPFVLGELLWRAGFAKAWPLRSRPPQAWERVRLMR